MTFIKGTELNKYFVVRIKTNGSSERLERFDDEVAAKNYIERLLIDQPGDYKIISIKGGQTQ